MRLIRVTIVGAVVGAALSWGVARPTVAGVPRTAPARVQGAPLARNGVRADVAACFAVFASPTSRSAEPYYRLSPRVRLDTSAVLRPRRNGGAGVPRRLERLDAAGRPADRSAGRGSLGPAWVADSLTDSIRLSFSDGFSGALIVLAGPAGADTLRGRAENHWDFGPPYVTDFGSASAVRVPCR